MKTQVKRVWEMKENSGEVKGIKLPDLEKTILLNRGIVNKEMVDVKYHGEFHNPFLLQGVEEAVKVLKKHIDNQSNILYYTDYDVDGWGGGIVGVKLTEPLNPNVNFWTNHREKAGYGISKMGIDNMLKEYPNTNLIITADNGITAFEAVEYAKSKGIDIIITDHHDIHRSGKLPNADAVIDPKRLDSKYPFSGLCGAAVLWKFLQAFYYSIGRTIEETMSVIDIVATSTVADMVPILDENRKIVREGLKLMNNPHHENYKKQWDYFRKVNPYINYKIDEGDIGFKIGPSINAISRLRGNNAKAIEAFLMDDSKEEDITEILRWMNEINEMRKSYQKEGEGIAFKKIEEEQKEGDLAKGVCLLAEEIHEGVAGLVSSNVTEFLNRPSIILTKGKKEGYVKGSGRSIDGFNIKKSVDRIVQKNPKLDISYGGHSAAMGMTLKEEQFEEFKKLFNEEVSSTIDMKLIEEKVVKIDYVFDSIDDIDFNIVDRLLSMKPYGMEFPKPVVAIKEVNADRIETIGETKEHVKLIIEDRKDELTLMSFYSASYFADKGNPTKNLALVGTLDFNEFMGDVSVQFLFAPGDFKVRNKK